MAERLIPAINIEAFRPKALDRSPETNLNLLLLMRDFCGNGSVPLCKALKAGSGLSDEMVAAFNEHVFRSIGYYYDLPPQTDPQEFYMQSQKHAKGVVEHFGKRLPEMDGVELKDEVSLLSDRPSSLFRLLTRPPDGIDPILSYEAYRHALLLDISAGNHARTLNGRLLTRLADVQHILNDRTFEGPEGAGFRFVMESVHDDETNQVIGFPDNLRRIPPTAHLKLTSLTVRKIRDLGLVYTYPRKKDDINAMIKAIVKAKGNGGLIKLDSDVQDPIGIMITSVDDQVSPEEIAERVVTDLKSDERLKIKEPVEKDDQIGCDHGQAAEGSFKARRKIRFEDIAVPIELIFCDRETYLNSRLEVGTRDQSTGLFMGRSHRLFEVRREYEAAPVIFPPELYPDLGSAFINRSKRDAQELRDLGKVAT